MKGRVTPHPARNALKRTAVSTPAAGAVAILTTQRVTRKAQARTIRSDRSLILPGLFFLLILSILVFTWTRVHVVHLGYEISAALNEKETATLSYHELTVEKATLSSAQRLERRANERLGMYAPGNDQVVIIR